MKKTSFLRIASLIGVMALLFSLISCQKESDANLPDPTEAFYVLDSADVLSADTENYIVTQNQALCALTGAEIVVACIPTTGTQDIADYVTLLFNKWEIGDEEKNNGVLLLLSIEEDDYWALQGKGLEDLLSSGAMKLLLQQYLEPDFAEKQYDSGVRSVFDALCSHLESVYQVSLSEWNGETANTPGTSGNPTPAQPPEEAAGVGLAGAILWLLILLVLIVLIVAWLRSIFGGPRGGGGGGGPRRRTFYYSPPPAHFGTHHPSPYRPTPRPGPRPGSSPRPGGSFGPRPGSSSRPGGSFGSRPGSASRSGGSFGPRPGSSSRSGGSFGSRPGSSPRSGGGGMSRGGGAGRR